jgi:hypothetical protein
MSSFAQALGSWVRIPFLFKRLLLFVFWFFFYFIVVVVFVFSLVLAVVVNGICFVFIAERCPLLLCFVYCVLFGMCCYFVLCPIVVLLPLG